MTDGIVPTPVTLLTEEDAREILAVPLLKLCSDMGPTRLGKSLGGVNDRTIRDARDEKSTLSLDTAANLLFLDGHAFDGFLAKVGRRSVPQDSVCDSDILPTLTGTVHKLAIATDRKSLAGPDLHRDELLDAEESLLAAFDVIGGLLQRIERIKQGAAA
jgi:prepilin-type processing-associated H-X9-DG protein